MNGNQVCFLFLGELGLLSAQLPLCLGDSHAFPRSCTDQVRLEFGNHGQDIEKEPTHGISGVVDGTTDAELDLTTGEFINDVLCIAQ